MSPSAHHATTALSPDPLDEEQRALRESIVAFAQRELGQDLDRFEREGKFPKDDCLKCAQLGLPAMPVPVEYGGLGLSATTIAAALEGLGYGCRDNGLIFSLNPHMGACEHPIG